MANWDITFGDTVADNASSSGSSAACLGDPLNAVL
jgi:2-keto-4-pentenoate hydratase